MGIEIRPATFSDEEGALYLLEQLFEPPGGVPPDYTRERSSASFRWAVEQPNADILLAVDGNKAVGLTSVYADIQSLGFGPKCWLQDMVVDKERRSEGIGEQLMAADRLKRREYVTELVGEPDGDGRRQTRRVEKVLDAARGNAIANLLRLRLECFGQFQAGEEMRRLQEEVEHMHKLLAPYTERRPR